MHQKFGFGFFDGGKRRAAADGVAEMQRKKAVCCCVLKSAVWFVERTRLGCLETVNA